jgi:hypothetical protein
MYQVNAIEAFKHTSMSGQPHVNVENVRMPTTWMGSAMAREMTNKGGQCVSLPHAMSILLSMSAGNCWYVCKKDTLLIC